MRYFLSTALVLAALLSLGFSANVHSGELYSTSQAIFGESGEDVAQSFLNKIDPDTGEPTEIGPIGFQNCFGMDFEPFTNRLFAVCERIIKRGDDGDVIIVIPDEGTGLGLRMEDDDPGQVLIMLDIETGEGTEIGPLGFSEDQVDGGVTDISFSPSGILHAITGAIAEMDGDGGGMVLGIEARELPLLMENTLLRIDTTTGRASVVGPTGTGNSFDSIGFAPNGSLYHATDNFIDPSDFNMLSTADGAGIKLADIAHPPGFEEMLIYVSMDHSQSRNQLFALLLQFPEIGIEPPDNPEIVFENRMLDAPGTYLTRIDPDTGEVELVGLISGIGGPSDRAFGTLAFLNQGTRAVPTLSEWGLMATGALLLFAALIFIKRRKLIEEG